MEGAVMNHGLSDKVRARASMSYVRPAIAEGRQQFSISVKDLLSDLKSEGFPSNHARQVCMALRKKDFLRENGIEIQGVDGPPSKTSPTVVIHYRVLPNQTKMHKGTHAEREPSAASAEESPEEWAHRVTGKLAGVLKDELAEYGGGEAFIRWVRGYDEEDGE
jgi:hypothetical protein